jgi:hypothetical protein
MVSALRSSQSATMSTNSATYPGYNYSLSQLFSAVKGKLRETACGGMYVQPQNHHPVASIF